MSRLDAIVDISHHQSAEIDFNALKAAGIVAVMHKATQGSHFKDSKYDQRRAAAEQAGLLWGAYHFAENREDSGTGAQQAKYFLDRIGDPKNVFLSLDFEGYHHKDKPEVELTMSVADAEDFIDAVHQHLGRFPFFYSGSTVRDILGNKTNAKFAQCKLWAAGYVNEPKLKIQRSWNNWTLWQYTDGKPHHNPKPIDGFGSWDRSVFDGSEQQLRAIWAS